MPCPAPAAEIEIPRRVALPRSSTRLQLPEVYCKLVGDVIPNGPFGTCRFDGKILKPGAAIEVEKLPRPAVVIECAGQQGIWQRGKKRDYLYILWRFDFSRGEWQELARALARDASWTAVLKQAVWQALHPRPELVDIIERSRSVADELVDEIDKRLRSEMPEVRATALHLVYERVSGRIAECA
jgi:hypothetical protein